MKQKSLRQLAKELGVSHSYLSQIRHGKRPASAKVVSKMVSNSVPIAFDTAPLSSYNFRHAGVAELADAEDLKSSGVKSLWVRDPPPALLNPVRYN